MTYQGRLEARGMISLDDFWPVRESDADTIKVTLGELSFAKKAGGQQKRTRAFEGAGMWHRTAKGREYFEPVVKTMKMGPHAGETRFTVRLQGVDAPELHYPGIVRNGSYKNRQHRAEGATLALRSLLSKAGQAQIPCVFYSLVDEPGQVVDKYGRFVGYVEVEVKGTAINLNHWLVEQGWAFPTFYDSCNAQEILDLLAASKKARKASAGIWQDVANEVRSYHGAPYRDPDKARWCCPSCSGASAPCSTTRAS